jgi:hypothetical protein
MHVTNLRYHADCTSSVKPGHPREFGRAIDEQGSQYHMVDGKWKKSGQQSPATTTTRAKLKQEFDADDDDDDSDFDRQNSADSREQQIAGLLLVQEG